MMTIFSRSQKCICLTAIMATLYVVPLGSEVWPTSFSVNEAEQDLAQEVVLLALWLHYPEVLPVVLDELDATPPEEHAELLAVVIDTLYQLHEEGIMPGRLSENIEGYLDNEERKPENRPTEGTRKRWAVLIQRLEQIASRTIVSLTKTVASDAITFIWEIPASVQAMALTRPFGAALLNLQSSSSTSPTIGFNITGETPGGEGAIIYTHGSDKFTFKTGGSERATLDATLLDVTGDIEASGDVKGATGTIDGDLAVDTDTLFVDSSEDRVGVGTVSPGTKFHVVDSVAVVNKTETTQASGNAGHDFANPSQTYRWLLAGVSAEFRLRDVTGAKNVIAVGAGADGNLLDIGKSAAGTVDVGGKLAVAGLMNLTQTSTAADPTTTEYPNDGDVGVHHNTTSGNRYLVWNDGGTIFKVQMT